VFTQKGIDKNALNQLFKNNQTDLENKYTTIVVESKQRDAQRKERAIAIRNQYYPQVQSNRNITFTQRGQMRIVGRVVITPSHGITQNSEANISIKDLDGNQVAFVNTANRELATKNYNVETWDGNNFIYKANRYYSKNNYAFLQELVIDLIAEGYMLEHQIDRQETKHYKAKVDLALKNSINVYGLPGYVIDKDGNNYNGNITILFERLDINQTGQTLPEYGADNYGQKVYIKYRNEKGRSRQRHFNAKNNNHFCVKFNDGEDCYYGLKTKGEASKKLQNLDVFKFNNAYYYKLLEARKGIMLLQDPVETQKYVVKINTEDKGQMIDNRNNEKLSEKLAEYLMGCPSLAKEIKQGAFDLKIADNLYQIIEQYETCIN
jgi:hypothetical protein